MVLECLKWTLGVKYDHARKGAIGDFLSVCKCSNLYLKYSNLGIDKNIFDRMPDPTKKFDKTLKIASKPSLVVDVDTHNQTTYRRYSENEW